MEARKTPSFTTAMRGYDREEVDEYVDSLAKALEDLEEAGDQNRRLQSHLSRLNARILELENRIRSETPHTVGALGERITLLLTEAETGAARAIEEAEARASGILEEAETKARTLESESQATARTLESDSQAKARTLEAEAQAKARTLEAESQAKASRLVEEAERRATSRTRQVEEWEQQVVAHTHAQQAYQERLHQEAEERHNEHITRLAADVESTMAALRDIRDTVDRLLERAAEAPALAHADADAGPPAVEDEPEIDEPESLEEDDDPPDDETGETAAVRSPGMFDQEIGADEPEAADARSEHRAIKPITPSVRAVS